MGMKRDPILLAKILYAIEERPYGFSDTPIRLPLEGEDQDRVDYHLMILAEGGMIIARNNEAGRPEAVRLTWKGHDYVDNSLETVTKGVGRAIDYVADEFMDLA